ncbi:hypothetical protein PFISCL1PPCAC_16955, partial [Pristionchus fissidentatus]
MLLSRMINGKEVIYRACDDPNNGIIVDKKMKKERDFRGKLLYINPNLKDKIAINLSPNIIVIKCSKVTIIANDDSPLVYFCPFDRKSYSLFVLDTTTMEIFSIKLPERMNDSNYHYYFVGGVHEGEIIVRRRTNTIVGKNLEYTDEICKVKFSEAIKMFEKAAVERDQRGNVGKKRREEEEK